MKRAILVLIFICFSFGTLVADDNTAVVATTDYGQKVVLLPDSTWKFLTRNPGASAPANNDDNAAVMASMDAGQKVVLLPDGTWKFLAGGPSADNNQAPPPPPPIVFSAPPEVVVLPGTNVYVAPDIGVDVYFFDGFWWRPYGGRWYRSPYYDHGWGYYSSDPGFYRDVPEDWRHSYHEHQWEGHPWNYERIHHDQVERNWNNWERDRHWEQHGGWGVEGYKPHPHEEYHVNNQHGSGHGPNSNGTTTHGPTTGGSATQTHGPTTGGSTMQNHGPTTGGATTHGPTTGGGANMQTHGPTTGGATTHGPTTGGATMQTHGPTTGGASHGPTGGGAGHGPTGGGASHGPTGGGASHGQAKHHGKGSE